MSKTIKKNTKYSKINIKDLDLELKEEDKNEIKNELIKSEPKKKVKYSKIIFFT